MSALGQKQTCAMRQPMSALLSIATAKADFRKKARSALPPKADMCGAIADVRYGPKADIPNQKKKRPLDSEITDLFVCRV